MRLAAQANPFTVATAPTHHCDAEAPDVRLDTVALLVQVWVDPLGLKEHQEGQNDWLASICRLYFWSSYALCWQNGGITQPYQALVCCCGSITPVVQ